MRPLSPLYVCCGDDPLLVIESTDSVRQQALAAGYSERTLLIAGSAGFDWNQLLEAAATCSFFSPNRLIELRIPNGKPGVEGAKILQQYAKNLPEEVILIVVLPSLGWQEKKAAWFKTLTTVGQLIDVKAPRREQLPTWIAQRLGQHQQAADAPALRWFADHVEGNLLAAHQEILKLSILYPVGKLSLENIQLGLSNAARYTSDQLSDALLSGSSDRYWRILDTLIEEGEPLPLVLWRLGEDSRTLFKVLSSLAKNSSKDIAFKEAKLFYERRQQFQRYLSTMSLPVLTWLLLQYGIIDRQIKGLVSGNPWETLRGLPFRRGMAQ